MGSILDNQLLEKKQNSPFHIKNLPNELINYIFSYVSLVSFDKKEMMMYIIYYKAKYFSYSDIFSELISFNGKNMYHIISYIVHLVV